MDRLKRALLLLPAAIAIVYAAVVGLEAVYVGLSPSPESLVGYGFEPGSAEWRFRSRGHYFWYGIGVSTAFTFVGLVLKRLLRAPAKRS